MSLWEWFLWVCIWSESPLPWSTCSAAIVLAAPSIRQFSWVGISTRSVLITSGPAPARALYDREHEGLPSLQTLIYKTCSFWNWLWPLPHLQWTSAFHCMGFLISLGRSLCSLISHVLFFCWDIKVCTVALAHSWMLTAYTDIQARILRYTHADTQADTLNYNTHVALWHEAVKMRQPYLRSVTF